MPLQHLKRHLNFGGRGEIRTHGGLAPTTVFKTVALNRSATLPILATNRRCVIRERPHYSKQLIVLNILIWKKYVSKTKIF